MFDIIASIGAEYTERIDIGLFDRRMQKPLVEYAKEGYEALNSLPYITIVSHEYTTDATEMNRYRFDKEFVKSRTLKKENISKLIPVDAGVFGQLTTVIKVSHKGETSYISKMLDIPEYVDPYHIMLDGSKRVVINQIVDNSTYVTKGKLKMKTAVAPVNLLKVNYDRTKRGKNDRNVWDKPFVNTEGIRFGDSARTRAFVMELYTKTFPPILYFLARFGLEGTISYFSLRNIVDVVQHEYDNQNKYYFSVTNNRKEDLFIEVDKYCMNNYSFVANFVHMLFRCFDYKPKMTMTDAYALPTWKKILGSQFIKTADKQELKGDELLVSFERLLDKGTKDTLQVGTMNKSTPYAMVRWLMTNHAHLINKDNNDLDNKRVRSNELMGAHFTRGLNEMVKDFEDKSKLTIEYINKRLKFGRSRFIKALTKPPGPKQPACVVLNTYSTVNDMTLYNSLKTTVYGLTGMKSDVPPATRDIYPSYIGRLDLNAVSSGNSCGLTSMLVLMCKLHENGFFSPNPEEPQFYNEELEQLLVSRVEELGVDFMYDPDLKKLKDKDKDAVLHCVNNKNGNVEVLSLSTYAQKFDVHEDTNTMILTKQSDGPVKYIRNKEGTWINKSTRRAPLTNDNISPTYRPRCTLTLDSIFKDSPYRYLIDRGRSERAINNGAEILAPSADIRIIMRCKPKI